MTTEMPDETPCPNSIRNPNTGQPARTGEEAVRFGKMIEDAEVRREAKNQKEYMDSVHPKGLAEIRLSDGTIARPGGSKDW